MSKDELVALLNSGDVNVVFTKADGTEREMLCTKRVEVIPAEAAPKGVRQSNPSLLTVWDLVMNAWRSFNFDRVISYEPVAEN